MKFASGNDDSAVLVEKAFDNIREFRRTKRREFLTVANDQIGHARVEMPDYLPALMGEAVLDDLDGRAVHAIEKFQGLLARNPPFRDEVEYHLGVAFYHRYNLESLAHAIEHMDSVIGRTSEPQLECRARVARAQALAMRMIPRDPRQPDLELIEESLREVLYEAQRLAPHIAQACANRSELVEEVDAALLNAAAMARMYWSDYRGQTDEKIQRLQEARELLETADTEDRDDWAIHCDLASLWMRLGYWRKSPADFARARDILTRVVDVLRPGYGFAFYELGRVARLQATFDEAQVYFDRALAVPYEFRDVSDRRINLEKSRAEAQDRSYP